MKVIPERHTKLDIYVLIIRTMNMCPLHTFYCVCCVLGVSTLSMFLLFIVCVVC